MAFNYIPMQHKCFFCGTNCKSNHEVGEDYIECPICGKYFIRDDYEYNLGSYNIPKLRSYLYYHKGKNRPYIADKEYYDKQNKSFFRNIYNLTPEMVENWYPKSFAERIDKILQYLFNQTSYVGESKEYTYYDLANIYFISDLNFSPEDNIEHKYEEQIEFVNNYLGTEKYISMIDLAQIGSLKWKHKRTIHLTPKGLSRVDELQKSDVNNKNIFVSMAFNDGTKEIREAIRTAIIDAGYSPEFIDEIIHNHQIMPEMFRLIKECKYLILEITDPNYGAYYEAGYALGLGKEVIICCSKEIFTKDYESGDDKKYAKYLKPHFDIAQKQILVWDDLDDLKRQLPEWIKVLDE